MKTTKRTPFTTSASCLLLLLTLALPAAVQGQLIYTTNSGAITITGLEYGFEGELTIPSTTNGFPVTSIAAEAFKEHPGLTGVTIPDSVLDIGAEAFSGARLTNVTIGNGVVVIGDGAFYYCDDLTNAIVGNSVTNIGAGAFGDCQNLISITIPNSVTSIGNGAFGNCRALSSVTIGNSVANIGNDAFWLCYALTSVTIPESVTIIGDRAFNECYGLTNVTMGNSVTIIGAEAFHACYNLTSFTIPNSVTSLGNWVFHGCSGLTNVTIGDSVTNIGDRAFSECLSLLAITVDSLNADFSSVDGILFNKSQTALIQYPAAKAGSDYGIPSGVTSIESSAFDSSTLTNIAIPATVTNIADGTFLRRSSLRAITVDSLNFDYSSVNGVLFNKSETKLIQYPAGKLGGAYSIPNSVTNIETGAFDSATNLTGVTIPNSVTAVANSAFLGCSKLAGIVIPDSVTSLGDGAFGSCSSLTNVTIGSNITSLSDGVFGSCLSLPGIAIPTNVTSIGNSAFKYCRSLTSLMIPDSVTNLGDSVFMDCLSLTGVTIGNSVPRIPYGAFMNCDHLGSITVPNNVTSIGLYAFAGCVRLNTANIGNGVTNIGGSAFYPCIRLAQVYFDGNAPDCGYGVFAGTPSTIYYWLGTTDWSNPWQGRPTVERPTAAAHISLQPASQTKSPGSAATFTVTATGSAPLNYQWYKDSSPLTNGGRVSGATTATLTLLGVVTNDEGSYTVTVTNLFGSDTSDPATLTMSAGETNRPLVSFLSPADRSEHTTNQIVVTGKASDTVWLDHVLLSVNGGVNAVIANPGAKSCNWTNLVTLLTGTNTVAVRAVDSASNTSAVASRTFFLRVPSPLLVYTNGNGWFTPTNYSSNNLFVGRSYTVTAKPGTNWLFTNWTASVDGGPTNHASNSATYTFLMQTNLTLIANFVTNRFIAAGGMYYGLFTDEATPMVSFERSGLFTLKTDSKQKFSGSLYLNGNTLSYSGSLDLAGYGVSKPIVRKGKSALQVTVQMTFDGSDSVSGNAVCFSNTPYVSYGAFTSAMTGFKAINMTNNPATNLIGDYTLAVDVPTDPLSPKGNGYGTITVKPSGLVVLAGYLGDYAGFKPIAVPISKDGDWPLYATTYKGDFNYIDPKTSLPKTVKEYKGAIIGWMKFTNNPPRELLDSSVHWIKTANTNNFYAAGFTNHDLVVFASAFNAPTNAKSVRVLDITNGNMVFVDGDLPLTPSFSNHFFMKTNSQIIINTTPFNVNTQSMAIAVTTGSFKGKFYHPNDPLNRVRVPVGVVLQDENIARGVFKGTNSTGSFLLKSD